MKKIKFEDMVKALAKDGADIILGLTPESSHLLHMAVGVQGEIGELIENVLSGGGLENKVEEFGDIEFYFEGLRAPLEYDFTDVRADSPIIGSIDKQLLKLSMCGGALLDAIKKMAIYEKPLDNTEVLNQMYLIRVCLANLYCVFNIKREQAIEANIAKLGKRYSSGSYSNNQAQTRADKK